MNVSKFSDFPDVAVKRPRPSLFGIRRKPAFHIGLHDYVNRPNGLLNFLEMVGGLTLFSRMSSTSLRDMKAVRFLSGTASTFGISGAFMLAANLSSPTCAYYLPRTLYYVLFHGMAAACYLMGSFYITQGSNEAQTHSMIGFCTGALHAFHSAYASYKIYIQKRDSGWF